MVVHHQQNMLNRIEIPDFRSVKPRDKEALLLEVCEKEFGFEKIPFFKALPRKYWLRFFENMKKKSYSPGDQIYAAQSRTTYFYVMRKGTVV